LKNLTASPHTSTDPAWSPDGSHIAFVSRREGWFLQVYVMDADGKNARRLTDITENAEHPQWAPDGRTILFFGTRSRAIWSIGVEGASSPGASGMDEGAFAPPLKVADKADSSAVFASDGAVVLFLRKSAAKNAAPGSSESGSKLNTEIWMAAPDGKNAVKLNAPPGEYHFLCQLSQ
ncbi:MAG: TolB family protein, partial [bacterium]